MRANYSSLGEYVFDDMGMDRLLFFQENSEKLILGFFNSPISVFLALKVVVCSVFHQIFAIPPIAKICMKNASKSIFLQKFENFRKICLLPEKVRGLSENTVALL